MPRLSITAMQKLREDGTRIAMLTCYDASFAAALDAAGVDSLLIGDSLGMVLQGHDTTLPVALGDMAYHTRCVARGSQRAFLVSDMPFGSYQESPPQAFRSAAELMAAGAQMVKLEGGAEFAETVRFLTARGIPCARIWASRPGRCTHSAAIASRARAPTPSSACSRTRKSSRPSTVSSPDTGREPARVSS